MHAVVTEILAHRAAGIRRQELHRCRLRCRRGDDDRILQRAVVFQRLDQVGDGRALLADGDVDAVQLFRFVRAGVGGLLVQDRVEGDGALSGLAVADDQLTLAAADRHQGVDGLQARLHRLGHRLARDDGQAP